MTNSVAEFAGSGAAVVLATDDGTAGFRGTATAALEQYFRSAWLGEPVALYGCGPEPMLRALVRLARERKFLCQVSLEGFMGCGIGVCLSCARKRLDPASEKGWTFKLTCRDGPVVDADDIYI
jgi:dihydroorotate dehydrogenase electron transfer subunit